MATALWKCPGCGRRFVKVRQWHSCHPVTLESHFRGRDTRLRHLFERLIREFRRLGPLRIDAVRSGLGGVRVLKGGLRVGFLLDRRINDARIARVQQVGPSAYVHAVIVREKKDFGSDLLSWLQEAYDGAARR